MRTHDSKVATLTARRLQATMAIVVAAGLCVAVQSPGDAAATPKRAQCRQVRVAAHRGVHDASHTENTIRSAQLAVRARVDVLEGDLRQTRDGVWVMMHDASVTRTTRGRGKVARLTYAQIRRLTTNDGVRGGVPTADAELAVLDSHPEMAAQFEIKPTRVRQAALRRLLRVFARHHLAQRITITSSHAAPLAALRRIDPRWRSLYLTRRPVAVSRLRQLGQGVSIEKAALTPAYAAALHREGLIISVWTVDTQSDWNRVIHLGVTTLVSNRAPAMQQLCAGASG